MAMIKSTATPKQRLLKAASEFLEYENCEAFAGPLDRNLYLIVGPKKHLTKLMDTTCKPKRK